jgi:hypothetical protein
MEQTQQSLLLLLDLELGQYQQGGVTGSIKVEEYGEQVRCRWCKPTRILALVELEVLIQQ